MKNHLRLLLGHGKKNSVPHNTPAEHGSTYKKCDAHHAIVEYGHVVSREMCFFCFDVLHNYLYDCSSIVATNFPKDKYALFVTLYVGKDKKLHGCQGTFTPHHLIDGLREYTIKSAFLDSRFEPFTLKEFSHATVSVSLLTSFETLINYDDWCVRNNGIRIEFHDDKLVKFTATYLPEVAARRGWDKETTIESLIRKAGYSGPITQSFKENLTITKFCSQKISVSYEEYAKYKKKRRKKTK